MDGTIYKSVDKKIWKSRIKSRMKIVVTGATSFIGTASVRRFLLDGQDVFAVIRPGSKNLPALLQVEKEVAEQMSKTGTVSGRLQIVECNLSQIERISERVPQADVWVHLGWDGAGSENRTRRDVQQNNVVLSLASVRAAVSIGCGRFLFSGSQAEYGVWHQTIDEDTPCHPVSEYGKAKVDFYNQAKSLCKILKMEYIHTRIFSVYGPGDHPWSLVNSCLDTWTRAETMKLGPCTQNWNFLYIEDMAEALSHLLSEGREGTYNIASMDTRPLRSYVEEMYEICGSEGSFLYGERPQNAEGPADLMPDIQKICRETSWRPKTSFAEGIYETLHCLRTSSAGERII